MQAGYGKQEVKLEWPKSCPLIASHSYSEILFVIINLIKMILKQAIF